MPKASKLKSPALKHSAPLPASKAVAPKVPAPSTSAGFDPSDDESVDRLADERAAEAFDDGNFESSVHLTSPNVAATQEPVSAAQLPPADSSRPAGPRFKAAPAIDDSHRQLILPTRVLAESPEQTLARADDQ